MSRTLLVTVLVAGSLLASAACGGEEADDNQAAETGLAQTEESDVGAGSEGSLQVTLDEQNGSGQTGTATLFAAGESKTRVVVQLGNPPGDAQPAHIHKGTCEELSPAPAYPLDSLENGQSETTVDVSLGSLQGGETGPFAVNVHKSEAEAGTYVACGNIPSA